MASRSPPTSPPVGFRTETTAAGPPSASGANTWSGSAYRHRPRTVIPARRSRVSASVPSRPTRAGSRSAGCGYQQEVVADPGEDRIDSLTRLKVHGRVFPDRRVGAAARLDADDPRGRQGAAPDQKLRVLLRVDVVGDHGHVEPVAQPQAQRLGQRGLARADGTADSDLQRAREAGLHAHDLNSLVSSVAWRSPASSRPGLKLHRSSTSRATASEPSRAIAGRSRARTHCPCTWPRAIRRSPAPTSNTAVE